ncbi:hypothetical protein ACO22_01743 [Paracoccidioides brasiliensis]|uniref:PRISE-like Rossmann-fold domain-containing protein n=1 Tax=Paracoccidioides brasiliensis TaxID=121759 RepID=A0A1D2JKT9_PARBR|nr:hypothetical protein ACO22_01743 [Paracoccidioides brasiliensis]
MGRSPFHTSVSRGGRRSPPRGNHFRRVESTIKGRGADMIAKSAIHFSLCSEICINGQGFNVSSSSTPWNWERKWPVICFWFRPKVTTPVDCEGWKTKIPGPNEHIRSHEEELKKMGMENGLEGWKVEFPSMDGSENWGLTKLNFDRSGGFAEDKSNWSRRQRKQCGNVDSDTRADETPRNAFRRIQVFCSIVCEVYWFGVKVRIIRGRSDPPSKRID